MNIQAKPNYLEMPREEYADLVIDKLEEFMLDEKNKMISMVTLAIPKMLMVAMTMDAVIKFQPLNLSPNFAAAKIIAVLSNVTDKVLLESPVQGGIN